MDWKSRALGPLIDLMQVECSFQACKRRHLVTHDTPAPWYCSRECEVWGEAERILGGEDATLAD